MDHETISLPGDVGQPQSDGGRLDHGIADLFGAHQVELVRLAMLMTGDLPAAEDIVQDVSNGSSGAGRPCRTSPMRSHISGPQ